MVQKRLNRRPSCLLVGAARSRSSSTTWRAAIPLAPNLGYTLTDDQTKWLEEKGFCLNAG